MSKLRYEVDQGIFSGQYGVVDTEVIGGKVICRCDEEKNANTIAMLLNLQRIQRHDEIVIGTTT